MNNVFVLGNNKNIIGPYEINVTWVESNLSSIPNATQDTCSIDYMSIFNEKTIYRHIAIYEPLNAYFIFTLCHISSHSNYIDAYYSSLFPNGAELEIYDLSFTRGNRAVLLSHKYDGSFTRVPISVEGDRPLYFFN